MGNKPKKGGRGRPFQPGQTGNAGGRPRSCREVRELAQSMSPDVLQRLFEICMSESNPMASVKAGIEILDRAHGRSPQSVLQLNADAAAFDGNLDGLSALLLRARLGKEKSRLINGGGHQSD